LSQEQYSEIQLLFNKSEGRSDDEKLENMFKEIETIDEKNIKIMSIHKSKGLGADYVFMIGLNEGVLPNKKRGNDSIESQRRLFYVGVTRAKQQLFLYSNIQIEGRHANKVNKDDFKYDHRNKVWNGKSSSFISELKLENK
jgi:superfamily I DNA/RNA helicase